MRRPNAVIFDLDGTLSDSAPAIDRALGTVWASADREPQPLSATMTMIGDGPDVLIRKARAAAGLDSDSDAIRRETDAFLAAYAQEGIGGDPYPGAVDVLRRLREAGLRLAVCTNKPQAAAERLVSGLGFSPYLDCLVGGDATPARKPDPAHVRVVLERFGNISPAETLMVGDGLQDVAAAEAASVPVLVAAYGYGGAAVARPELPAVQALADIPGLLLDGSGDLS